MNPLGINYIRHFSELSLQDVPLVGQKIAALAETHRELRDKGIVVPEAFALTTDAYVELFGIPNIKNQIDQIFCNANINNYDDLAKRAKLARELIYQLPLSTELTEQILNAFRNLRQRIGAESSVAVRSSLVSSSFPKASFAGQHANFLHIETEVQLIEAIRRCFTSLFNERAICYRLSRGFNYAPLPLAIFVMKMVRSDIASSGVMFTVDTESGFRDVVFVTATHGLGDVLVQGVVEPDEFYVFKPGLRAGRREILFRTKGQKKHKSAYTKSRNLQTTKIIASTKKEQDYFSLSDQDVLSLADMAVVIENHFVKTTAHSQPLNIEWAKDGIDGQLYILQVRPETVVSQNSENYIDEYRLIRHRCALISGHAVGNKIAFGVARVITDSHQFKDFKEGEILIAETTTPEWLPIMRLAAAIVTVQGGRTSHTAIIARELDIPAVVGCPLNLRDIATGDSLTVSCVEGITGHVYAGRIPFKKIHTDISHVKKKHKTALMQNISSPAKAFRASMFPNDGAGLVRVSTLISEQISLHPMAFLHPEKTHNQGLIRAVERLQTRHAKAGDYVIQRLSESIAMIAAAYFPKPVMLAFSDFTSVQFSNLSWGRAFEPEESNPILGLRGAARYVHPLYVEAFQLECMAIKRVREDMGLANIKLLMPFCRKPQEAQLVFKKMEEFGLTRGVNQLEIYLMCETPNNIIQIEDFAGLFDGFFIALEELTQLLQGIDRHSNYVAWNESEIDTGAIEMIHQLVRAGRKYGKPVMFSAGSSFVSLKLTETLVQMGMSTLSVDPEAIINLHGEILRIETEMAN